MKTNSTYRWPYAHKPHEIEHPPVEVQPVVFGLQIGVVPFLSNHTKCGGTVTWSNSHAFSMTWACSHYVPWWKGITIWMFVVPGSCKNWVKLRDFTNLKKPGKIRMCLSYKRGLAPNFTVHSEFESTKKRRDTWIAGNECIFLMHDHAGPSSI